jgi:hypothetical protein
MFQINIGEKTMKLSKVLGAVVLSMAAIPAFSVPLTYQASFTGSNGTATGSVNGFSWFLDNGAGSDFVSFFASAGSQLTFAVDRLNPNLDPTMSLYAGTTSADTSLFASEGDWGGLTFLTSFDDERGPATSSGPAGDPFGTFTAETSGFYTVAIGGGSSSTDNSQYGYSFSVAAVPEPSTAMLTIAGLGALIGFGRKRRKA